MKALAKTKPIQNVKKNLRYRVEKWGFDPRYLVAFYGIARGVITLRTGNFELKYREDSYSVNYVIDF